MLRRTKTALRGSVLILAIVILNGLLSNLGIEEDRKIHAQTPETVAPPNESQYAGLTKCAACHYKQYEDWKTTPHAKAFDYLPTKYRNDTECLQCHASRHGRDAAAQTQTNDLPGVSCEDCHGPGREHTNLALSFVGQNAELTEKAAETLRLRIEEKELTDEAVEKLRSLIQKQSIGQCFRCHNSKGHKPHPKFDRDETATGRQRNARPRGSFFEVHQERP